MTYKELEKYQTALLGMWLFDHFEPTHYMTLAFRHPMLKETNKHQCLRMISRDRAKKSFLKFVKKWNSTIFGRRSKKAFKIATFIEGGKNLSDKNVHFHVFVEVPESYTDEELTLLKDRIIKLWKISDSMAGDPRTYNKDGDDWFAEIVDEESLTTEPKSTFKYKPKSKHERLVGYSLKEAKGGIEPFLPELSNFTGRKLKY